MKFDERVFPYRNEKTINRHADDHLTNILTYSSSVNWVPYDKKMDFGGYKSVKYNPVTDDVVLQLTREKDTYTRTTQHQ